MTVPSIVAADDVAAALARASIVLNEGTPIAGGTPRGGAMVEALALLEETARRLAPPGTTYAERVGRAKQLPTDKMKYDSLAAVLRALEFDFRRGALGGFAEGVRAELLEDQLATAEWFLG
jgi:hypothetical protein